VIKISNAKSQRIFIGAAFMFALFVLLMNRAFIMDRFDWRPSLLEHNVAGLDSDFQFLWQKSSVFLLTSDFETYLTVQDSHIIFAGSLNENGTPSLFNLDLLTGDINWQTDVYPTGFTGDSLLVYTGSGNDSLVAREISTGTIIWKTSLPNAKNFIYLIADQGNLHALSSTDNYYRLDSQTGQLQQTIGATNTYFIDGDLAYSRSFGPTLIVKQLGNGTVAWQTGLSGPFSMKPMFTKDIVFIKAQQGAGPIGQIVALDRRTGAILWQTAPGSVLSNIAVSNGLAFYLTSEAQLYAVNAQTGDKFRTIEFLPAIPDEDIVNRRFAVAASENSVVVYLGDSQQMFVFRVLADTQN
jgi:hypothetical protein